MSVSCLSVCTPVCTYACSHMSMYSTQKWIDMKLYVHTYIKLLDRLIVVLFSVFLNPVFLAHMEHANPLSAGPGHFNSSRSWWPVGPIGRPWVRGVGWVGQWKFSIFFPICYSRYSRYVYICIYWIICTRYLNVYPPQGKAFGTLFLFYAIRLWIHMQSRGVFAAQAYTCWDSKSYDWNAHPIYGCFQAQNFPQLFSPPTVD
jgi:hypothetical protein